MQEQLPTVNSSQGSPQAHAIRTRAPSAQELCEFLFIPTLTEACAVIYAHNYTGVKVQLQHCRLDWICSGFLVRDIWNPAGNYRTLAFGPLESKAFGLHSLKVPIGWLWGRISFVCEGGLDQGLQNILARVGHGQWRKPKWQTALGKSDLRGYSSTPQSQQGRGAKWNWKRSRCTWANSYYKMRCIN